MQQPNLKTPKPRKTRPNIQRTKALIPKAQRSKALELNPKSLNEYQASLGYCRLFLGGGFRPKKLRGFGTYLWLAKVRAAKTNRSGNCQMSSYSMLDIAWSLLITG